MGTKSVTQPRKPRTIGSTIYQRRWRAYMQGWEAAALGEPLEHPRVVPFQDFQVDYDDGFAAGVDARAKAIDHANERPKS